MREIAPNHEAYWFETYGGVALTGQPVRFIQEARDLNRWFDVYAFRLGEAEDRKVAILFTNVTERKKAEADLRLAQIKLADRADKLERAVADRTVELTQTNKQLETFMYTMAHDLRAPLRAMQGFSEMLMEEAGPALNPEATDCAHRISASAQVMDTMLRDLVAFSGIAEQKIEFVPIDLQNVVKLALDSLKTEIQQRNATVQLVGPWPGVLGHEATLGPVLVQLIGNAIRFVAGDVPPAVQLRAEVCDDFVRVWVEDNGIGIAPDHQEQIFKLFSRLHGDKYGGTGIGLAMVKKGIDRMGGQVGVESTPGEGSRFWFELKKA